MIKTCDGSNVVFTDHKSVLPQNVAAMVDRAKTCCFTGHRPDKLPGRADRSSLGYRNMRSTTVMHIEELYRCGYDTFIIGMSRGFDLMVGDILATDAKFKDRISLICAVPYIRQFEEMKTKEELAIYRKLICSADLVALCSMDYCDGCYKVRNQLMVNCSSAIIGYVAEKDIRSGAMQTVRMAGRAGLHMRIMYGDENPQFTEVDSYIYK